VQKKSVSCVSVRRYSWDFFFPGPHLRATGMSRSGGRAVVLFALGLRWTPGACCFALPMQIRALRPIACAAAAQRKAVESGAGAQCFLFTSCQAGAEKLLKAELARTHPELRFAYSRPGRFMNSCADGIVSPTVSISSSFSRVHGASVGQARTVSEICGLARQLFSGRPLCLHMWGGDLGSVRAQRTQRQSVRERPRSSLFAAIRWSVLPT